MEIADFGLWIAERERRDGEVGPLMGCMAPSGAMRREYRLRNTELRIEGGRIHLHLPNPYSATRFT